MGGKWKLAPWIVRHFPPHSTYVEPFGGAANVLIRKPRAFTEVYNDLDREVVNLFRVLRDPAQSADLISKIELTPFARDEFELTYEVVDIDAEPVEAARRLVARSFMGHGSTAVALRRKTSFRVDRCQRGIGGDWRNLPDALWAIVDRLRGVMIENRPAATIIDRFDGPSTLIYADPPYLHATRSQKRIEGALEHAYAHEMTDAEHEALLEQLLGLESMVVLSGYANALYDDRLRAWDRLTIETHADGARPRTEVLWINPAATAAFGLFGVAS